ncbi:apolipoprotein L3-like [Aquarana catesbeiana]|uniref:apolipoprotein L3-like n=1 Tax=Aquarana catesbeiana TaxID=8400 RepID=UPI003CCA3BCB
MDTMDKSSEWNNSQITEYDFEMSELEEKIGQYMKEFRETQNMLQEHLSKCIEEMRDIANCMDEFHRKATIASVTGSSVGIAGGITTLVGLALTPFTFGASLIVSAVGMGVATAGGLTGAVASVFDNENIKKKLKRVEEIVGEIQKHIEQIQEISKRMHSVFKKLGINDINNAATVGGILANAAVQVGRLVRLGRIIATAARGAEAAAQGARLITALSGVLAGLFLIMDTFFIVKGAQDLKNGCKTKEAAEIRDLAEELIKLQSKLQSNKEEMTKELEENSSLLTQIIIT